MTQVGAGDDGPGQAVGDALGHGPVRAPGKAAGQVPSIERRVPFPGNERRGVGHGDDPQTAGGERPGAPASQDAGRGDAFEFVAVHPAEHRDGRTGLVADDRQHLDERSVTGVERLDGVDLATVAVELDSRAGSEASVPQSELHRSGASDSEVRRSRLIAFAQRERDDTARRGTDERTDRR